MGNPSLFTDQYLKQCSLGAETKGELTSHRASKKAKEALYGVVS
jgi:hypothetical protein